MQKVFPVKKVRDGDVVILGGEILAVFDLPWDVL